jgi:hypothetical protein
MTKPRTAPSGGKPHTAPEYDHAVLPEIQQRKLLGVGEEHTLNLGHPSTQDKLVEHPAPDVENYDSGDTGRVVRGPARSQSVYGRFRDPKDGTSTSENLSRWSSYAHAGSYQRGDGTGKEVSMPDPRGRRDEGSDEYLLRPDWSKYEYGADSGPGRLEKSGKR